MSNKRKVSNGRRAAVDRRGTRSTRAGQIAAVIGGLVAVAIVAVIAFTPEPVKGVPDGTESIAVGEPLHVEGELHADGEVPAGGEHNPQWLNCGYYDTEVDSEYAVHSLEHGAVWIAFNPDIGQEEMDRLRRFVRRDRKVIVSPVTDLDEGILVTAWGNQLAPDSADDARIEQFVNEFAGSNEAPEPTGACRGGVGDPSF